MRRFATALVVTYLASTDRFSVCNAGHPRPLFYRAADREWSLLAPKTVDDVGGNLPLGLDEATRYRLFDLELGRGDLLVFYTDALTEAADTEGRLLGEAGFWKPRADSTCRPQPRRDRPGAIGRGRSLSGPSSR